MQILQNAVKQAEFTRVVYSATPDAGTKLADVLIPTYWAHVAKQFAANTRIEAIPADNTWFAELIVRNKGPEGVTVAVLRYTDFNEVQASAKPEAGAGAFRIGHTSSDKWRVVRLADKTVVASGFDTRAAAETWLADNEQLV